MNKKHQKIKKATYTITYNRLTQSCTIRKVEPGTRCVNCKPDGQDIIVEWTEREFLDFVVKCIYMDIIDLIKDLKNDKH